VNALYALLRLMRFGLAPTAAADAAVIYFLTHADPWSGSEVGVLPPVRPVELGLLTAASVGLYCFGMVQNDLVDRARDALNKRDRPVATGELSASTAAATAAVCAGVALGAAWSLGLYSLLVALITLALINAYHLYTKTRGGVGLLNLGLVRLCNAMMYLGDSQLTWPPFVIFAHITLMSTAAYRLEGKPPPLGRRDAVLIGVGCALVAGLTAAARFLPPVRAANEPLMELPAPLGPTPAIATAASLTAFAAFLVYVGYIQRREHLPAAKRGGLLIKNGLLYLFVLDASFLIYDRRLGAAVVLSGLPVCWALMTVLRRPGVFKAGDEPPDRPPAGNGNGDGAPPAP
jgi:4-hydroxybenzoate polyprenyltransferase